MNEPFANKYRPKILEDIVGQEHLLNKKSLLYNLINNKRMQSIILFGPPGVGKTTLGKVISNTLNIKMVNLNAVSLSVSEIRKVLEENEEQFILFLDEIHLLQKKVQQSLLESMENGNIILIGSTSENPYFTVHKAILSRCLIFEFKPISYEDISKRLSDVIKLIEKDYDKKIIVEDDFLDYLSNSVHGDIRNALNRLESLYYKNLNPFTDDIYFKKEDLIDFGININLDSKGSELYDLLSCLHKSVRGSDENAGLHYLARILQGGNNALLPICRRILAIASEDIGLSNPNAIVVAKACVDSALQLGMPEARLVLSQIVIYLSRQPKSNSCSMAIDMAIEDVSKIDFGEIPDYLKDAHYSGAKNLGHGIGYKYPHNYENNWVKQQYLPDNIKDKQYYVPGDNKLEQDYEEFWKKIKK